MIKQMRGVLLGLILAAAAFGLMVGDSFAQSNIDQFVVTGDAAKRISTKVEISLATASKIMEVCLNEARKRPQDLVSIFILSPSGQVVNSQRLDGAPTYVIDSALLRAQTALYWKESTRALENQAEGVGDLARQMRMYKLGQFPADGGLPIIVDGQLIGSIGVSGAGNHNEEIAKAGLTTVLGPQPPAVKKLPPAREFKPRVPGPEGGAPRPEGGQRQPGAQQ